MKERDNNVHRCTVKYRALKCQSGFFLTRSKCPFKSRIMEEKWMCICVHNQGGTFLVL